MKSLLYGLMVLAGPALGLASEFGPQDSLLATRMPYEWDSFANRKKAVQPAAGTNTAAPPPLPPAERLLELASRPLFPRGQFQAHDRLKPTTLGLRVETQDGEQVVTTPVGLGMSYLGARGWRASVSPALLTNLDRFEHAYRAALVPQALGGPGFTFAEARQAALRRTLAGWEWPDSTDALMLAAGEPAWSASLRVELKDERAGAMASPLPGAYPDYLMWPYNMCGGSTPYLGHSHQEYHPHGCRRR
jgi:hypothetical protein